MTVSSTTKRNSYTGNGSTTTFAYSFKIFDDDDITVILRTTATGTETVQTKTTHYSVTGVGNSSGGNVVFGSAPTSAQTVVLLRQTAQTQATDYTPNDPFPAASHEDALDKLTLMTQDQQDELDRSIKLSRTNTMTSTEFTVGATDRANKILAFDSSGELSVTQELGTNRGDWAASTSYNQRDIVKDTSTGNIFFVNEAHTSSGSQPLTTNTNSSKYDLLIESLFSGVTAGTVSASKGVLVDGNKDITGFRNITLSGELTLGSGAVINEAELEAIDGVTAGTVAASKAVVVDSNKDAASFRNITLTGELDAGSLDISGDADIDGTLEADAMTLNGTAITATATLDTGISNNNVPKFTSGVADNDFLRVDGTAIEGRSASEVLSDIGAAPAAGSSNIVTTGALNSGSITSGFGAIDNGSSNITTTGVGSFGSLDISGDIDVDGTTNLDVVDIDGAVDMASTLQVDGAITSSAGATITTADNTDTLTLVSTDADANVGPVMLFKRDSSSPADNDFLGYTKYSGENDADEATIYAQTFAQIKDASDGTEDGSFSIGTIDAGTLTTHLVVDSSGIDITGGFTATAASTITTANNTSQLILKSTDADDAGGPGFDLLRDSSSPANSDDIGYIRFRAKNSNGDEHTYGFFQAKALTVTDGSEDGGIELLMNKGGSNRSRMEVLAGETVFNEDSVVVDFRVESNGNQNMLFVDGENDLVGIGGTPNVLLHVIGPSAEVAIDTTSGGEPLLRFRENGSTRALLKMDGSNNMQFHTGPDGSVAEVARFNASGHLNIGQSSTNIPGQGNSTAGTSLRGVGDAYFSRDGDIALNVNRNGSDGKVVSFRRGGTEGGSISVTTTAATLASSSDSRLKSNIQDAASASDKIDAIQVRQFDWNETGNHQDYGLIAQELQPIEPLAVVGSPDSDEMMGIDNSKLVPMLIKEIQELRSRMAALEASQ